MFPFFFYTVMVRQNIVQEARLLFTYIQGMYRIPTSLSQRFPYEPPNPQNLCILIFHPSKLFNLGLTSR